jgi:hypothetical protein
VVDISQQHSRYDAATRTFIEAPCPVRVDAQYDAQVDQWLQILAGPRAEKLNQWLACLTRLDEPCAALYLEGAGGAGKSLLAMGASRVFTTERPADLAGALHEYNDDVVNCPIVLADETVPKDFRGTLRTDAIREFIQARTRRLNRKFRPVATVRGCARVILAANNRNLLATSEHLTEHDIAAIVERFLFIPVSAKARAYLESVDISRWIDDDVIARHIVWLTENLEVEKHGRFLVSGEAADLTNTLSTGTGLRAAICQWTMGLLLRPNTMLNRHDWGQYLRVSDGRLLMTARAMAEHWTEYVPDKGSPPSPSAISRALAGLSGEVTVRAHDGNRKMRSFNLEQLAVWAEETGYSDRDTVTRLVRQLEVTMKAPPAEVVAAE